jgi:hypothetical protein
MLLERYASLFSNVFFPNLYVYVLYLAQFAGSSWEALKHIRQAVDFLVCLFFAYY